MKYLAIVFFILWIYLLTVLKRGKTEFFHFLVGSVGAFVFCMLWLHPLLTNPVIKMVTAMTGRIGKITGFFDSYYQFGALFVNCGQDFIAMYIDYECSGIVEIFVFSCLLWFFPVYSLIEKAIIDIAGIMYIVFANVLRISLICIVIHFFGNDSYFIAHTVLGRIIFYGMSVLLYFYVFTKSQILRQKVGKFNYGN